MKVAFRVDASQQMGTGHLRRCLALAHALSETGAVVRFVTRNLGIDSAAQIEAEGFAATELVPPVPDFRGDPRIPHSNWAGVDERTDAAEAVVTLRDWSPDWVVVDCYAFGAAWHQEVRLQLGCRLAAIDDMPDRQFACDVLIDHNFATDHVEKYRGRLFEGARLLGGPRFALLGSAFAGAPRYEFSDEVRSIGIFMGGVDAAHLSARVLDAVDDAGFSGPVEVVTTSANPNLADLREKAAQRPGTGLVLDLPHLADFFGRHDIQVGAGGGATWERCCIGVPTLLLVVAQNQEAVAPQLAQAGIVTVAGSLEQSEIARAIRALIDDAARRRVLAERARALVDGLGARRVALALLADWLTVRPATTEDGERMYRWRNDPVTRRVSRSTGEISREDHAAWLDRTLANPERALLIAEVGTVAVGVIRFDRVDDGAVEVSLYLDPGLHGLGLGKHMLREGEAAAGSGLDIAAEVMEGNAGSVALFESAGYERVSPTRFLKSGARMK